MEKTPTVPGNRAQFGYKSLSQYEGSLPNPFPRIMGPNALRYVSEVVESGLSSNMVDRFEAAFCEAIGVKHCVSAPGCSNALMSLAESLNFNPGDEVLFSPITDYGTIMGFVKCGYIPVFADTEPDSILVSADTLRARITDRTRAIVVVHKCGLIPDMDPITALGKEYDIPVIEDCCQAIFSTYKGHRAGSMGHAAAFSFDSEKTMGSDIGGCFVTNDDALFQYAQFFCLSRGAAMRPHFGRLHTTAGSSMRMPSCTAAINLAQLEILPENVATRDRMIRKIYSMLETIPGISVEKPRDYQEVFSCWMAGFRVDTTHIDCSLEQFCDECVSKGFTGLGIAKYYNVPLSCTFLAENSKNHNYPYCAPFTDREYSYDACQYPNACAYLNNFLRWATFCEKYTDEDCDRVYAIVREVAKKHFLRG